MSSFWELHEYLEIRFWNSLTKKLSSFLVLSLADLLFVWISHLSG